MSDKRTCETCDPVTKRQCEECDQKLSNYQSKPLPTNPDKVGYEKAKNELRQKKSWGGLADEVIDKLEALALAEGREQALKEVESMIMQKFSGYDETYVIKIEAGILQAIDQLRNKGE